MELIEPQYAGKRGQEKRRLTPEGLPISESRPFVLAGFFTGTQHVPFEY